MNVEEVEACLAHSRMVAQLADSTAGMTPPEQPGEWYSRQPGNLLTRATVGSQNLILCTGGSSASRCMNPVSPDDPDDELCHECMQVEILKLEENLMDAIEQLMRYRRAVK